MWRPNMMKTQGWLHDRETDVFKNPVLQKAGPSFQISIQLSSNICTKDTYKTWLWGRLHGKFRPTRLKICCDYMANFSPGAMFKIGRENLRESVLYAFFVHNSRGAHAQVHISARAEMWMRLHEVFQPGLRFSLGWNSVHVIASVCLKRFVQEAELKSQPG